jgi:uncharacterized protein
VSRHVPGLAAAVDQGRRGFWLRHLHRWHWISSALCLVGMFLFAVTGITLNHAGDIAAEPVVAARTATLPASAKARIAGEDEVKKPLPEPVRAALHDALGVTVPASTEAEWSPEELFVELPRPGGDGTLRIDRLTGVATLEITDRGWISWLNDLHKGRNTGAAWSWFIDAFAAAAIVFTVTGLFLLQLHGRNRPATWPVVGLGLLVPLVLALLFVHH